MPVDFLTEEQRLRYGQYADEPSAAQLARYFYLDDADRVAVGRCRGVHNRLGYAVQLGTVRYLGTFLADPTQVPEGVTRYIAEQLGIEALDRFPRYKEGRPHWYHTQEIRESYGYREFGVLPESFRLVRWLYTRAWLSEERPSLLFDMATSWLVEKKVLLPGVTVLARLISRIRERVSVRLWRVLAELPSAEQRLRLESLLEVTEGARTSKLERLRRSPTRVSAPGLIGVLRRLEEIRAVGVAEVDVSRIPPGRLKALARYAGASRAAAIERMPGDRRLATLLAFARSLEFTATDEALDVLDLLLTDLLKKAEDEQKQHRVRTLPDLDAAADRLATACEVLLDDNCEDPEVRKEAFARVPREVLRQAIGQVRDLTQPKEDRRHEELLRRYIGIRRFLPSLLRVIAFQANQAGNTVLQALEFLTSLEAQRHPNLDVAPTEGMSKSWLRLLRDSDRQMSRKVYTLYAMERLQEKLRRRDVYVLRSERWGDPRAKLLQGKEWEAVRPHVLRILQREQSPATALGQLRANLDATYRRVSAGLPSNTSVRLERNDEGKTGIVLSGLDSLPDSPSLIDLRKRVRALLPRVDLPEALLEIHARTGFADCFTHISEGAARVADLHVSVCAVLIAEACNIGLEPLVRADVPALTRSRLSWVLQNYLRRDTLIQSNACLVKAQKDIPLVRHWGEGEVASADGLRFVVPVRTVNAGPNPKYFVEKGITYYNYTSDQFTGIHGIVIPGTLRDSMVLLDGLLEQQTVLDPREIMTDTAGSSDLVFGLFWLLGYQFSPRLADIGEASFWRMDPTADYGPLNDVARHRINIGLITRNWDDCFRVAGSLKLGKISGSELIRSLLRSDNPTTLGRAISELGRILKTTHLLNYIDDENYRRRILIQLNRGEQRHKTARRIHHGHRGEVRKRYRQGQEDHLSALGLVVNVIVLWNTLYMDAAVEHLRAQGYDVKPEDLARLAPLENKRTVNTLGQFSFALPEHVKSGALRPLREPTDPHEDDEWEP
jgi:TnpA family transposase